MPGEVYLVGDMNAWVAERGGLMGFGGRRVMGIGLPLLQLLSVSQFAGVLAHEFGHYYGGDTKLGPWIYKTRAAIGRTLAGLGDSMLAVAFPLVWQSFSVDYPRHFPAAGIHGRCPGGQRCWL